MSIQEEELEMTKTSLIHKVDFNLHDLYHIFDVQAKGFINHADIRNGLQAIDVYPPQE